MPDGVRIDAAEILNLFEALGKKEVMAQIAATAYQRATTGEIVDQMENVRPLTPRYREWKRRKGYSTKPWEMTGATKRALSSGPLTGKPGTEKTKEGLFMITKASLKSHIEVRVGKGRVREKKDRFYHTNARRPIMKWTNPMIRNAIEDLAQIIQRKLEARDRV